MEVMDKIYKENKFSIDKNEQCEYNVNHMGWV